MSEDRILALLEERRGYIVRKLPKRVAAVDAELERLGYQAETTEAGPAEIAAMPKPKRR